MLNQINKNKIQKINKKLLASALFAAYAITLSQTALCQVIPDSRTGTSVTPDASAADVLNVTTTTTRGINAFNSFSKFNVSSGTTVNLHLGNATNLINLINDTAPSSIDGILNSIKNGMVGGNVYLLNPYGVLVGENGRVNVGSLNILTPSQSDMDKIINSSGEISDTYVNKLLNNEIPVTASGVISVNGKVNAIKDINLQAGTVNINGDVLSAAAFQSANVAFDDVVNINEYNNQNLDIVSENGEIVIKAVNDIEVNGKVFTDGANNLNAGNIIISSGKNITAKNNAVISASGKGLNSQGGTISLKAENNGTFSNAEAAPVNTSILIQNALLKANNIELLSSSQSKNAAGLNLTDVITLKNLTNAGILNYTGSAGYLNADSKAEVIIDNGSQLFANNNIFITADSNSNVNLKNYLPGVTYGESRVVSLAKVVDGANISTAGNLEIKSLTDNKLILEVVPPSGGTNVSVAMTEASSDTQAYIQSGANILANNIKVGAFNNTDVRTQAAPVTALTGLSGTTVALSNVSNNTKAYVGSNLNIAGNLDISAYSAAKNIIRSQTSGSSSPSILYNGVTSDINSMLANKLTGLSLDNIPGNIQLASALSYSKTANDVNAYINDGAGVKANNINIKSLDIDLFQVSASSKSGTSGSFGGVFAFGDRANNVNAYIGNGATVDSKHALNISSETILPYRTDFDLSIPDLNLGWPDLSLLWPNIKLNLPDLDFSLPDINFDVDLDLDLDLDLSLPDLNTKLGFEAEVSEGYLSSYADSKKADATVAGSINISNINNQSSAYIGNNARINTDRLFAANDQNINISATAEMDKINYTGIGRQGTDASGAGGAYGGFNYNNKINAFIDDNSLVYSTGNVLLDAKSEEKIINIARAGSSKEKYGVIGAISDNQINNTVKSYIKGSSNVNTGGDLNLSSLDKLWTLNIAGGVVSKANIGAGISISNNNITQDIASFIGKKSTDLPSGIKGNIQANNINLLAASDNGLYSFSLAGATGSGSGAGKFGVGISGDASLNKINSKIWSYINDDVDVVTTNNVVLSSDSLSSILALSGAAATTGTTAGIAGSYSDNDITLNTGVSVENAKLTADGDINLTSNNTAKIKAAAIGAAKATEVGVAGSVAINNINSNSDSSVQSAVTVVDTNNLNVDSSSDLKIYSVAGGVGVAGAVGAGAAYVNNDINNTTKAKIESSAVNAGNVNVSALSRESVKSLSAAAGVAKTAGIAGSIALNNINSTTEAFIDDNAVINSNGNVLVKADSVNSDNDIESYAGTLAGGLSVGVGGTIATNKVEKTTKAHIDNNVTVNAGNNVEVKANSGGDILVKTGNVGAGLVGVTATVSANVIKNTTDAYVENASVTSGSNCDIVVSAKENSKIDSFKIAAAVGKVGVGASGDINVINNQVSSLVAGNLLAGKDIQIIADSTEAIDSNSHAFSGGLAALAGSISGSSIGSGIGDVNNNSIPSKLVTEISNGVGILSDLAGLDTDITGDGRIGQVLANVSNNTRLTSTAGNILIKANNTSDLSVKAGGYSLGGVAFGGSIAVGSSANRVKSLIENNASLIANSGNVNILSTSNDVSNVNSYGGSAGLAVIAGSVAELNSDKTTSVSTGIGTLIKGNNVELKAWSSNDYDIKAEGDASGVVSVAGSLAMSNLKNDTSVTMNSAITSDITANIISLADNNINQVAQSTAGKSRSLSGLASDLFSGDLLSLLDPSRWFDSVLSIGGGVSSLSFDNDSTVNIGNNASIVSADTNLDIGNSGNASVLMQAISNNTLSSDTDTECNAKAVALGAAVSRVDVWTDSLMNIGDNALIAGKTIGLTAQNNIDGISSAKTNINPTDASITGLTDKIAELLINNFLWGKLNGVMSVSGLETSFRDAIDDLTAYDVAWDIFWDQDFNSITSRVSNITTSAQNSLNSFNTYKAGSMFTDATNYFKNTIMDTLEVSEAFMSILPSLYGDANSVSRFDLKQANANININSGAKFLSKNSLSILAENNEITSGIYSGAESIISNNIFGNTNAKSYTDVNSDANITVADGSLLESNNISITSDSDINKTGYVNTSSRGTVFNIASGNLTKSFNLNFFNSAVSSILGSPTISWDEGGWVWDVLAGAWGWVADIVTETVNIASECGSRLNTVTKTAGINDTFTLLTYQNTKTNSITSNQTSSAALNGNINLLGASERILTVNSDGSINPASNLTPTITDKITVDNMLNISHLNISVPHGTLSGTAKIKDIYYYAPVTIVNNSAKDLVIKDFNMLSKGNTTKNISAQTNNLTFNTLIAETKFGNSKLDVYNPNSNLIFTGQVGAPDTSFIISSGGNISGTGATLIAKNIDLASITGNINDLNFYLTNHGQVNAQSGGLINIGVSGINYLPAEFGDYHNSQDINLNNLTAGTSLNFNINGSLAKNYTANSLQGFVLGSDTASNGLLNLTNLSAGNDINITSAYNTLNVNTLNSTAGNASLIASYGSINDANNDLNNIKANNINIVAENGSVDLDIDSNGTTSFDALNSIDINETSGNLIASLIKSTSGNIKLLSGGSINATSILGNNMELKSTNGAITAIINSNGIASFEALNSIDINETSGNLVASLINSSNGNIKILSVGNINAASISGNNMELKSLNGDITSRMDSNGKIYAEALNDINIEEISGNMNVDNIESKTSNVRLTAYNSILDANNDEVANVLGQDITLISNNADIGEVDNYLDLESTGNISAVAQNNIYLRETLNNMNISLIQANSGNIGLIANNSILNARNDEANNIIGNDITLKALNGAITANINSNGTTSFDALNSIDINETSGNLIASLVNSSNGNIKLLSDGNINATSILGNNMELKSTNGAITANIDSNGTTSFDALKSLDITETSGDLIASLIKSQANIKILADGSINADSILGNNMDLKSTNGGITANIDSNGIIYAQAQNAINIEETLGNMNVDYIESKTSNVNLIADNSILDANNSETSNILGQDINLVSNNADIGGLANYLDIKSTGITSANAQNNIYLRETDNNLNIGLVEAKTGDIGLTAYNSILNARIDDLNNIVGKNITLNALNGSLGDASKLLNIKSSGTINMRSNGNIYFANSEGDLNINEIIADSGSIGINVTNGNAFINYISAPDKIYINVTGDTLNIGTIDPTEISFKVSGENGQINITNGFVSEKVTLNADNINAKFTDTNLLNPLQLTLVGNDGLMANYVDLNLKTSMLNSDRFNANKSIITLGTDRLNMNWVNVGKTMDIKTPGRSILVYNSNDFLGKADVQLYSLNKPFSLAAYLDSLVKTSAFVTNYDKSQIVNNVNSENSIVKASYKNTTKIQYLVEDELNPIDMSTMAKNQRNNIRFGIDTIGTIKLHNNENAQVKITNISSGGASILSKNDLPMGEEVQVSVLYNGLNIKARAKVVRKAFDKTTGKYDLGLAFNEIDESVAKLIPYACMSAEAL